MNADFLSNPKAVDVLNKPRFPAGMFAGQSQVESDQDRLTRLARNVFNHQKLTGEIPENAVFVPPQFSPAAPPAPPPQAAPPVQIVAPASITTQQVAPAKPPAPETPKGETATIAALQAEKVTMPGDDAEAKAPQQQASTVPPGKRAPEEPQAPSK